MKTLVIIESPGKKKKLATILGAGFRIEASFGHIRDLPEKSLGVAAPDYTPDYGPTERSKATIAALKKAVKEADRVLLATDPDREGEAIAWHIADVCKIKKPERIAFGEITATAVKAAVAAPRPLDLALVRAQEARRVADRLVGYTVSPELSQRAGQALSAGRVQSPAVRLVVERERAIRAFVPVKHYGATLLFPYFGPVWSATWIPDLPVGQEYQTSQVKAEQAAAVKRVRVHSFEDGESRAPPPAPFTTSSLQQAAQAKLKIKPKQTMELAQRLYEQGVITYMRTDSPNLSEDAITAISAHARAEGLPLAPKPRTWTAKASAQEAHEAIRPTDISVETAGTTEQEQALYRLIRDRAIASQLADAVYAVRTAMLRSVELVDGGPALYRARGKTLTSPGWKSLYTDDDAGESDDGDNPDNPVPALTVGVELDVGEGRVDAKVTKPPKRYTLATLIKALENAGIGRPATYAAILDNIQRRSYVAEDSKGLLSATATGELIVDKLVGVCSFVDLEYTRKLEAELDRIAEGKAKYADVVGGLHRKLQAELGVIAASVIESASIPLCDCENKKPLVRRTGKNGPFWACSGYPECRKTLPDKDGKPGARAVQPEPQPAAVHLCNCGKAKPLRRNTRAKDNDPKGKGWDFFGCTGYPECRKTFKLGPDGKPVFEEVSVGAEK